MEYVQRDWTPDEAEALNLSAVVVQETTHMRIARTLQQWVEGHPSPDMPALSLAEMGEFSPRQILEAVQSKTELGRFVEVLVVNGVRYHPDGLDGVLRTFAGSGPRSDSAGMDGVLDMEKP